MASTFKKNHAVLIGIADYHDPTLRLDTPSHDAEAIAELLADEHGFEVETYHSTTKDKFSQCLRHIETVGQEEDARLLIYYAGHGVNSDLGDGPKGYFLPADCKKGDLETFVPMQALLDSLERVQSRHVLVILDCCFAGSLKWARTFRDIGLDIEDKVYRQYFDLFIERPTRQVLTSTSPRQKALDRIEDGDKNSPFAKALLEALRGKADLTPDGVITLHEIQAYLRTNIALPADAKLDAQTCQLFSLQEFNEGEFLFFLDGFDPAELADLEFKNPYKGLSSFEKTEKTFFFGRKKETQRLLDAVLAQPLTIVVGASGTGKSSLVKAGVVPILEKKHTRREVQIVRPGKTPMATLQGLNPEEFDILVIDQWEELITQAGGNEQEIRRFNDQILAWLAAGKKIIGTIRTDFEAQMQRDGLEDRWKTGRFIVEKFSADDYEEVIYKPALRMGCTFEPPELVKDIQREVEQQPGALPLLSFMMNQLYDLAMADDAKRPTITAAHYSKIGGVSGALQQKAEEIFNDLPSDLHRAVMQKICLRMVAFSAGELAGRRVLLSDLQFTGDAENRCVELVVRRLDDAKLIRRDADEQGRRFIEPAHDALVRAWRRLWEWVKNLGEENLLLHGKLGVAVADFHFQKTDKKFLWTADPRLEQAQELLRHDALLFNLAERGFVERSVVEKKRRERRNWAIASVVGMLILAAAVVAFWQKGIADDKTEEANIERNAALNAKIAAQTSDSIAQVQRDSAKSNAVEAFRQKTRAEIEQKNTAKALRKVVAEQKAKQAEERKKERLNFEQYYADGVIAMNGDEPELAEQKFSKALKLFDKYGTAADFADLKQKQNDILKRITDLQKLKK